MPANKSETDPPAYIYELTLTAEELAAVQAAFTDRFCRKVEAASGEDSDLERITADDVDLALTKNDRLSLTPDQMSLIRQTLLDFGGRTDETVKGLVRLRREEYYFGADDIVKRHKLGTMALQLARQIVSDIAPPTLMCPQEIDLKPLPILDPDALKPLAVRQLSTGQ